MSDDQASAQVPAVQRPRAVVADVIPVFDTGRFDHYGRIASVMAKSSIVPATLRDNDYDTAVANCFQVVELSDRWGYSPFAVAQCASVIQGKLCLEGKLIAAVLDTHLGLALNHYYIGEWGHEDYRIFVTDAELDESQVAELKPHQKLHGIKMIDGSVKEWRTRERSGSVKGNWLNQPDVQLQYRGDRTWAKVYRPAVTLGVLAQEDMDEFTDRRLEVIDQPAISSGFTGEKPVRRPRTPKEPVAATEPADNKAEAGQQDAQGDGDGKPPPGEHDDVHDGEFVDGAPSTNGAAESEAGGEFSQGGGAEGEQGGAEPSATTQSADSTKSPTSGPEQTSGASSPSSVVDKVRDPPVTGAMDPDDDRPRTRAPAGELYCLATDQPDEANRVPVYKDGIGFSRVKVDSKSKPAAYHLHPLAEDDDADAEGLQGVSEAQDRLDAENAQPSPFVEALGKVDTAPSYLAAKQVLKTLALTKVWGDSDDALKSHFRSKIWDVYIQLRDEGRETIAPYEDFMLMRLFLEFGATSKADIDQLWPRFWKSPVYKQANESDQRGISNLLMARQEVLP